MNLAGVRAELESELTWRQDEIRLLRNQLALLTREEDRRRFRKALVVMLYSHFEGFCKTAFSTYAEVINRERVLCRDAHDCLVAASLADVFRAFEDPYRKHPLFRRIPDDTQLHRFARQVDLVGSLGEIRAREVNIPVDNVVDVEANLRPSVLRRILYRLGFAHDIFAAHEGQMNMLLRRRNDFAHGLQKDGIEQHVYEDLERASYEVMNAVVGLVMKALSSKQYLRPTSSASDSA